MAEQSPESPDFIPKTSIGSADCAHVVMQVIVEIITDAENGTRIYPDSPLLHDYTDPYISSVTTDGPDGPTTAFWCNNYNGACDFSFLLRQPKAGLPAELGEEAFAIQGTCMAIDNLRRAFKRAWDAIGMPEHKEDDEQ